MKSIENFIKRFSQTAKQDGICKAACDQIAILLPAFCVLCILVILSIKFPLRMQALFLLFAFAAAVAYAWASYRQVEVTQLLVGKATLFVMEPIERFPAENTSDESKAEAEEWLIFKVVNMGERSAVNVDASVSDNWIRGQHKDIAERRPFHYMEKKIEDAKCALKSEPEEVPLWREWRLCSGGERFFYFPAPDERRRPHDQGEPYRLHLRWYDPNFVPWNSIVNVFWHEGDGKWCTNWDEAEPRRR